jgi:hypothetical protein
MAACRSARDHRHVRGEHLKNEYTRSAVVVPVQRSPSLRPSVMVFHPVVLIPVAGLTIMRLAKGLCDEWRAAGSSAGYSRQ